MNSDLARNAVAEIPASCICTWERRGLTFHWIRTMPRRGCPWHTWAVRPWPLADEGMCAERRAMNRLTEGTAG
jgi:hypothetical protein